MVGTDTLFRLLANRYRRRILFSLCSADSLQLPDAILLRDQTQPRHANETQADSLLDAHSHSDELPRDRIETRLQHIHIPKLEDAGVVEWNRDTVTVSRGPQFDEIEPALRLLTANQPRFPDDLL